MKMSLFSKPVCTAILTALMLSILVPYHPTPTPSHAAVPRRPNVLIVLTDDQRNDLTGMRQLRRWLGRGGTRFTRAFTTTPLCCPSRSSIFSGRYAHNHQVQTNTQTERLDQSTTMQRYLRRDGYITGLVGKFLNSWPVDRRPPYFSDFAMTSPGYTGIKVNLNGRLKETRRYATDYVSDRTVRFLNKWESRDANPWFMLVAPFAPHAPFTPATRHADRAVPPWHGNPAVFESNRRDKPPYVLGKNTTFIRGRRVRKKQIRTLYAVDEMIGRIMNVLRRLGERRNTLVIFVSDNGYMWGDHGLGGKGHSYSGSVGIPLLLRWPGRVRADATDRRLVANIDLAPTVLDATGVTPDEPMDGRSLFDAGSRKRILLEYWAYRWGIPSWASVRTTKAQYTEYYDGAGDLSFREYYDLENDRWQLNNRLATGPDDGPPGWAALAAQLAADKECSGATCP